MSKYVLCELDYCQLNTIMIVTSRLATRYFIANNLSLRPYAYRPNNFLVTSSSSSFIYSSHSDFFPSWLVLVAPWLYSIYCFTLQPTSCTLSASNLLMRWLTITTHRYFYDLNPLSTCIFLICPSLRLYSRTISSLQLLFHTSWHVSIILRVSYLMSLTLTWLPFWQCVIAWDYWFLIHLGYNQYASLELSLPFLI